MNYAEHIRNQYFLNKDKIVEERKNHGLSYVLTLDDKLKDSYNCYKSFCYSIGVKPKKIIDFLNTEII